MSGTDAGKALEGLMWAKFKLGVLREESQDLLDDMRDVLSSKCQAIPDQALGVPNPVYPACWLAKIAGLLIYWGIYWGMSLR